MTSHMMCSGPDGRQRVTIAGDAKGTRPNFDACPRAGAAFVHTYKYDGQRRDLKVLSGNGFRLEHFGPTGECFTPTSNRAELRAVLGALDVRNWTAGNSEKDNVRTLVIATDSAYVAHGCTDQVFEWENNGWYNSQGRPVSNRDFWEVILDSMGEISSYEVEVQF